MKKTSVVILKIQNLYNKAPCPSVCLFVCLFVTLSRLHFSTDFELKHMYGLLVAQGVPENYFPGDIPRNKKNLA